MSVGVIAVLTAALFGASPDTSSGGGDEAPEHGDPSSSPDGSSSPALRVATPDVDADAVSRGLTMRVGPSWREYRISVESGSGPRVLVVVTRPDGSIDTRGLELSSPTVEGRSRELAAAIALLVQEEEPAEPDPPEPMPPDTAASDDAPPSSGPRVSGWVGLGPRVAINPSSAVAPELGLVLAGGAWALRDHLQPVAELGWSRGLSAAPTLDAARLGAGVLGGGAVAAGRLWLGAGPLVRAQLAVARGAQTARGFWAHGSLVAVAQYRGLRLLLGAWLGTDVLLPPLVARDDRGRTRWNSIRPAAGLTIGLRLPPRR